MGNGGQGASLLAALRIQGRVLGALFLWEVITRYGRDNLGFIWLFLEPMIFTLAITALWTAIKVTHGSSLPIVAFALTGYSSVLLWRNCANRCSMALTANVGLLFHRQVRAIDLLLTKVFIEIAGATMSFVALSILWIALGWAEPPADILKVIFGWMLLAWFGGAVALIIGALTSISEIFERLWHPTAYILFPLSGAVFMVDWLSEEFQRIVLWLPMVNCTEIIREGYFGSAFTMHYDVGYVVIACTTLTLLGLVAVHVASRRLEFR